MHLISPAATTPATDSNRLGSGGTPRLSLTAARLPTSTPLIAQEVAPDWWLLTIRRGITNGRLIEAALDHITHAECWRLLIQAIRRDPLTPEGAALIRHLYPPRQPWPPSIITGMEAMGRITPWPHARHP